MPAKLLLFGVFSMLFLGATAMVFARIVSIPVALVLHTDNVALE